MLVTEERFGAAPPNRLVFGDALDVASSLLDAGFGGKVDLVYVDPPFASQASYELETRLDGPADGRVRRTRAFNDSWPVRSLTGTGAKSSPEDGVGAYLDMLAPRLERMAALLAPTGTLWVHLDWRAAYLVRVLLDEVFGRKRFLNEIVWRRAPNLGRQASSGQFGRTLDTIVVYGGPAARLSPPTRLEPIPPSSVRHDDLGRPFTTAPRGDYTDASMARLASEGRVHKTVTGRLYVKYFLEPNDAGELCRERRIDTLWTDIAPLRHVAIAERTGYPTQKPRALLDRIVRCATQPGGLVVDLFAGSGTFVIADRSPVALNAARARLLRSEAPFAVLSCGPSILQAGPASEEQVRVRVDEVIEHGAKQTHVELVHPEEPLAWAVAEGHGRPFVASWHSERRLGVVPVPASRLAVLPRGDSERIGVRVYGDDGSVATVHRARATVPA